MGGGVAEAAGSRRQRRAVKWGSGQGMAKVQVMAGVWRRLDVLRRHVPWLQPKCKSSLSPSTANSQPRHPLPKSPTWHRAVRPPGSPASRREFPLDPGVNRAVQREVLPPPVKRQLSAPHRQAAPALGDDGAPCVLPPEGRGGAHRELGAVAPEGLEPAVSHPPEEERIAQRRCEEAVSIM